MTVTVTVTVIMTVTDIAHVCKKPCVDTYTPDGVYVMVMEYLFQQHILKENKQPIPSLFHPAS